MKLKSIEVHNFRSIEEASLKIEEVGSSYTFTLIGINESGKSSFLEGVSLVEDETVSFPSDYHDSKKPITIVFNYDIDRSDVEEVHEHLSEKNFPDDLLKKVGFKRLSLIHEYVPASETSLEYSVELDNRHKIIKGYTLAESGIVKKEGEEEQDDLKLNDFLEDELAEHFYSNSHKVIFWKSEPKYLISDPVDLAAFSQDPKGVSTPLKNCFNLAGITKIKEAIDKLNNNPTEVSDLSDKLSDSVTAHVKKVWPNHPVEISFNIDSNMLTFLVKDKKVKYKSKTTKQRSDGFRQFVSFLLTISAQNMNEQLTDSILLLDEPETHLHPTGQEYLRDELIKITKKKLNNIVIFATHSNFMIDKNCLERCWRVEKINNATTKLKQLDSQKSSFSEVNYIVFEVPTNDYHNELYGYLEENEKTKLNALPKNKNWYNAKRKTTEKVSLATYIRHSIHHPENTRNKPFTLTELKQSINKLRKLKYK